MYCGQSEYVLNKRRILKFEQNTPTLKKYHLHIMIWNFYDYLCQTPKKVFFLSTPSGHIKGSRAAFIHGVEWLNSRPGLFTPFRKLRYPFSRILGGAQSMLVRLGKKIYLATPGV
jgi:hypothetical protein